jgi:hypothetical protein
MRTATEVFPQREQREKIRLPAAHDLAGRASK